LAELQVERADFVAVPVQDLKRAEEFYGTIDSGVCHMATFRDPDGNTLQLHRRYAPFADRSQP
jgi:predicted lactoylglutathione lyase